MSITFVRIDDRLIHGQVVESWIPWTKAQAICVVSDAAASDPTQRALMELSIPEGIELRVLGVSDAINYLTREVPGVRRVFLLAPGPREILELLKGGVRFDHVNVGGLHYSAGRVQLGKLVYISDEERSALRAIAAQGVMLEGRGVPSDESMDLAQLLA